MTGRVRPARATEIAMAPGVQGQRNGTTTARMGAMLVLALLVAPGCSVKRFAANSVANSLTTGPDVFGTDNDPELIRDALPFGLKTMESLLETLPRHRGLLLTLCRGFTQYGFAYVQLDAEQVEPTDYAQAAAMRARALKLFLRARDYGVRGLELEHRGIGERLRAVPDSAAGVIGKDELPMLYWTAAAWGSAVNLGKDQPELLGELGTVRALMHRGLALDETYDGGALHEAMILLEALPEAMGGSPVRAREHYHRALELSAGTRASPYITLASSVSVMEQNRAEFRQLLEQALAVDPDRDPSQRLANIVLQRRARFLLAHEELLFFSTDDETKESR
jgi:TRAP transporter T-component